MCLALGANVEKVIETWYLICCWVSSELTHSQKIKLLWQMTSTGSEMFKWNLVLWWQRYFYCWFLNMDILLHWIHVSRSHP